MNAMVAIFSRCLLLVVLGWHVSAVADKSQEKKNLFREKGAIYFEDFVEEEIKVRIKEDATVYNNLVEKRAIGRMRGGTEAVLLAMTDYGFRVRGQAYHAQTAGWVSIKAIEGPSEDFFETVKKVYERQKIVRALIDNGQIALGMTISEVVEVLGEPSEKSSRIDGNGRLDVYEFVNYTRIPQYRYITDSVGRTFRQKYYIQQETGRTTVCFQNKAVKSIEDSESDPKAGKAKIVPVPIELF